MRRDDDGRNACRVYVGNLPEDIHADELAEAFQKFGRVKDVDIKFGRTRNGTAYAFVEFELPEEAEEAIRDGDDRSFFGVRLKVEPTGLKRQRKSNAYLGSGPPVRSDHRVIVIGLPRQASWQDLKDYMRTAGRVGYAGIDEDGRGVVEYEDERGMERALRELHRSEFETPFARAQIKVYTPEDLPGGGEPRRSRGRTQSYSRGRSGSPRERRYRKRSASPRGNRRMEDDRRLEGEGEHSGSSRRHDDDHPSGMRRHDDDHGRRHDDDHGRRHEEERSGSSRRHDGEHSGGSSKRHEDDMAAGSSKHSEEFRRSEKEGVEKEGRSDSSGGRRERSASPSRKRTRVAEEAERDEECRDQATEAEKRRRYSDGGSSAVAPAPSH